MTFTTSQLIFAVVNLSFIIIHLYGGLLKLIYKPKAYSADFRALFPAQRAVGTIYLLQIFELPYLLRIGNPDALLYANAFALLVYSLLLVLICEFYFFPQRHHPLKDYWVVLPTVLVLVAMFLQAVGFVSFDTILGGSYRFWCFVLVGVIFLCYFWLNVHMALRIGAEVRRVNESIYADTEDFPVLFAQYVQWLPTIVCVLLALNFYVDSPIVKCIRDVLLAISSIFFCIFTLNPHRKLFTPVAHAEVQSEAESETEPETEPEVQPLPTPGSSSSTSRLSSERYDELSQRLDRMLVDEHIFTEQHITIDMLVARLGTNSKYITEVIKRSGYGSFYDMVNQHRVRYAISLISQHPDRRLCDIADDCGFASQASMNRAFASQGKPAPSTFRK